MAEIHVEKKPRSGWVWILILLLLLAVAAVAWFYWPVTAEPEPATTTSPATVTERSVGEADPPDARETLPLVEARML